MKYKVLKCSWDKRFIGRIGDYRYDSSGKRVLRFDDPDLIPESVDGWPKLTHQLVGFNPIDLEAVG